MICNHIVLILNLLSINVLHINVIARDDCYGIFSMNELFLDF